MKSSVKTSTKKFAQAIITKTAQKAVKGGNDPIITQDAIEI